MSINKIENNKNFIEGENILVKDTNSDIWLNREFLSFNKNNKAVCKVPDIKDSYYAWSEFKKKN